MPAPSTSQRASRFDGVWLAGAALLLYLALRQDVFFGADGYALLQSAVRGETMHDLHVLFPTLARIALAVLQPFGLPAFRALELLSACGTAAGVFCLHRTFAVLGHDRLQAAAGAAACALLPVTVFFATTVEVHGAFFLPCALSWLATARCIAAPPRRLLPAALLLGATVGASGLVHARGHLLLPLCIGFLVAHRGLRAGLLACAAGACGQLAVLLATWALLGPAGASIDAWLGVLGRMRLVELLPRYFVVEYLLPTFPMGAAAILAAVWRPTRLARAHVLVVVLFAWATVAVLVGTHEFGAYGLPLVFPAAWITLQRFGTRTTVTLAAVAGLAAFGLVRWWNSRLTDPIDTVAVGALAREGPLALLVADHNGSDPILRERTDIAVFHLPIFLRSHPGTSAEIAALLEHALDLLLDQGLNVFVTRKALDEFERMAPAVFHLVHPRYEWTARHDPNLDVVRIARH